MTTTSENDSIVTIVQDSSINETENKPEEKLTNDEKEQKENSSNENEDKNNNNDHTTIRMNNEEQKENHLEDDHRTKKPLNSKVKYSSMPYHRSSYYTNGHLYGPAPYYYYQVEPINEKPTPLMVIPTQPSPSTTTDNQTGNSTAISPVNLPPRLRQISTSENDSNNPSTLTSQVSTTSTSQSNSTTTTTTNTTTNGRRHRSILPRGSCNYYSLYPPPPLMATPPGVLYPYQPGHIAYNIRTPDELEILAFQQQFMNVPAPSPLVWPPPPTASYAPYPPYPMYGPRPYLYNNSSTANSNNSFLNPEAAEWVPTQTDTNASSSSDTNLLIDDDINFPPLNANRTEETTVEQQKSSNESSPDMDSITNTDNNQAATPSTPSKTESTSQDETKHLTSSSSSSKLTTISYSTVILQTLDRNKSNTHPQQQKHQIPAKQRTQILVSKETSSRKRQPPLKRTNFNGSRNALPTETPKQAPPPPPPPQQQAIDDWIEVKSKKTKKFDRSYDISFNSSERHLSDESNAKHSSLPSTTENTTATCTSDDEEPTDNTKSLIMIVENKTITTTTDYNQVIVDDIHQRLNNNERLLIIMRGCPGSGKSTLAKSLNNGYNGQILSIDEYFKGMNSNEYLFDSTKLEEAHLYNRRLASEAFKRNISPIIIDNTNTTSWEMKPYVAMGKEAGYDILLIEPQTPWRYKPRELVKRNLHNLSLRRIKEILNRFEHNITVQSIIDQLKTNLFLPCQSQQILDQNQTDTESIDPILISTKSSFENIDDTIIIEDVRRCIDDMILFLTSTFYQTSLSIPLGDLSLISSSSSPASPSTPHTLFHRSLTRLASSTTNQDHTFSNEHILRLPTTSYSRCFENFTPPSSTNSSLIEKRRRKNKTKQTSNDILLNTNNNNNNQSHFFEHENSDSFQSMNYQVYLPDDSSSEYFIIDEQEILSADHSSINPHQSKQSTNKNNQLLDIIHDGLTPSTNHANSSLNRTHCGIQCSIKNIDDDIDDSDRILIGYSSCLSSSSAPISPPPGHIERGIQVDLNENSIDSLTDLIEFYSDRLSADSIKQYYELCNSDIQWTRTQIDEYLQQNHHLISTIPTLRQLSLNALNQWNEQIKYRNPSFDTVSIADLLEDINDEEIFEDFIHDNQSIEISDSNQIIISSTMIHSLENLYGELPNLSTYSNNGLSLPLDDELALNIYQALQRFLGVDNKSNNNSKPVYEKKITKKNTNKQSTPSLPSQWISPVENPTKKKSNGPSLKEIMDEELNYMTKQKQNPKRQLDLASQHKFKALESHFTSFSSDVLYEIFRENEFDYDLTFVCLSSMLDENISLTNIPKSDPVLAIYSPSIVSKSTTTESKTKSYEISRNHARDYALKRKDYYNKADQANRHGMTGVASYYINQAREQTRLMKEANRLACEHIYQIRLNQFRQTNRLDLHELHVDEALHLFQQIEKELTEGYRRTTLKSIEIITGYGKNSPYGGGSGRIRSSIIAYLKQKNYKYSEPNKGAILVQL